MSINYSSIYSDLAGQEVDWIPGDTEQQYQQNQKDLGDWIDRKFTYKFNKQGFRCEEFVENTDILFLGCSYTIGVGLPLENTWSYLVAESLGSTYANLGQGGGSNDTAFRLGYYWIPKIKPKFVFLLSPQPHRFELITTDMIHFFSPTNLSERFKQFTENWMTNDINPTLDQIKNTLALEHICLKQGIKFINCNSLELARKDYARDLSHPGVESNRQFAQSILNKENWW